MKRSRRDVPNLCAALRALAVALLVLTAACSSSPVASPEPESVADTPGDDERIAANGSEAAGGALPPAPAPRPPEEMARYQLAAEYSAARSGHVLLILQAEEVVLEAGQYGPGHLFVFAEVLRRKLASRRADPLDYLKQRILDRIGLAVADWDRDDAGNPDVAFGAKLAAREWAKLGILLKNRGVWQGRTAVAPEAVAAVLRGSAASPEYGLGLWRNVPRETAETGRPEAGPAPTFYPDGLPDMVVAAGVGNQRLYVIPSLDLVVVRFGEVDRGWRDQAFLVRLLDGTPAGPGA